ncbi:MAG: hypothetical protein P4M00_16740 [Azospirillaceae bacterium]|nr:hypothetical protein [Azospirillaceae bacterium]
MTDEPESLTSVYLRRMDAKLDRVINEIAELKLCQNDTTRAVVGLRRDQVGDAETLAHVQSQIDRLHDDVDRIKRRLDLVEPPTGAAE